MTQATVRKSYSDEFKEQVLEELRNGRTQAELCKQHDIPPATISLWAKNAGILVPKSQPLSQAFRNGLKGEIPPRPMLHNVSRQVALFLTHEAMFKGLNNPGFCEDCRKYGVKPDDIRPLVEWGKKYGGSDFDLVGPAQSQIAYLNENIKQNQDQLKIQEVLIKELTESQERKNEALAQFAEHVLLKKA